MTGTIGAVLTVFGLGVAYFVAAIPAGVAMNLSPAVSAIVAWAGYTAIGAAMLFLSGAPRAWLQKKLRFSPHPDPSKLFWRIWGRFGLPGLALIAPVTCGPYVAVLVALALGERPGRTIGWIAGGVVPWCVLFAVLAVTGVKFLGE